jgi:hypothetical protein
MTDKFELVHIDDEKPPVGRRNHLSDEVLVFNAKKAFLCEDTYNLNLNRWLICRDTAKYWLKQYWLKPYKLPTEEEILKILNSHSEKTFLELGDDAYAMRFVDSSKFEKVVVDIINLLKGER